MGIQTEIDQAHAEVRNVFIRACRIENASGCGNEKAGIQWDRTAKRVRWEGNFIEVKPGQQAVEDRSVKR